MAVGDIHFSRLKAKPTQVEPGSFSSGVFHVPDGVKIPSIYPTSDSSTSIQIRKADNTTTVLGVDTTNVRIGVGGTPQFDFHVVRPSGTYHYSMIDSYNDEIQGPTLGGRSARGTYTSPTATALDDSILRVTGAGYYIDDVASFTTSRARISFHAAENFTSTKHGTYISVFTTVIGTTNTLERIRITDVGNLGLNTTIPRKRMDILDSSAAQLRLSHTDNSVYTDFQTSSGGDLTITPSGGDLTISGNISASNISSTSGANRIPIADGEGKLNSWVSIAGPTGPTGGVGSAGTQGTQGYQGYLGSTGPTGTTGSQGYQGFLGTTGPTGSVTTDILTSTLYPSSDSTTAIKVCKADDSTPVMTFDTTNGYVGLGCTPSYKFHAMQSGGGVPFMFDSYSDDTYSSNITIRKARGTSLSPTAVSLGDYIARFLGAGYQTTSSPGFTSSRASMDFWAAENFTNIAQGTYITFSSTPVGSITKSEVIRIDSTGYAGFKTTHPDRVIDALDASNPQLRLTHTDGSIYTDFQTDSGGHVIISTTGSGRLISRKDGGTNAIYVESYHTAPTTGILGRTARGSFGSPTSTQAGDQLLALTGQGYHSEGTPGFTNLKCRIAMWAAENFTDIAAGSYMTFETTPTGSVTIAERMRIDSEGNVGIGGTPLGKLHIIADNVPNNLYLDRYQSGANANIYFRSAAGTLSSPTATLVNYALGSVVASGYQTTTSPGFTTSRAKIFFYAAENFTDVAQGTYITFQTTPIGSVTPAECMRITDAGYVGIGCTPTTLLDITDTVSRSTNSGYSFYVNRTTSNSGCGYIGTRKGRGTIASPSAVLNGDYLGEFLFGGYDSTTWTSQSSGILAMATEDWTATAHGSLIYLATCPIGSTSWAGRLWIDSVGSVGINTSGPDRKLDVLDASNPQLRLTHTDGTVYTDFQTDSSGYLNITPIGGLSLLSLTDVSGYPSFTAKATTTTQVPTVIISKCRTGTASVLDADNLGWLLWQGYQNSAYRNAAGIRSFVGGSPSGNYVPGTMLFFTSDASTGLVERMRIDSAGNVGIGTTTPNYASATKALTVESTGDTGIEMSSTRADADGVTIADLEANYRTNTATYQRIALLKFQTEGTTANQRGGRIQFITKPDGVAGLVERMRIDSAGNVGINTAGPDRKLDILDASNPQLRLTHTDGTVYTDFQTDSSGVLTITNTGGSYDINSSISYCPQLYLTANQTTSNGAYFMFRRSRSSYTSVVSGDWLGNFLWKGYQNSGWRDAAYIYATVDGAPSGDYVPGTLCFSTGTASATPILRMSITSTGMVLPSTTNTYDLGASGTVWRTGYFTDVYTHDAGVHTSDERKKEIKEIFPIGLDFVNALPPIVYKWKDYNVEEEIEVPQPDIEGKQQNSIKEIKTREYKFTRQHFGFGAQTLMSVSEDFGLTANDIAAYIHDEKSDTYGVRTEELVPVLWKAVQELSTKNTLLEQTVIALTTRINALELK